MRKIYSIMFALLAFVGMAQAQVVFDFANNNLDLPLSNGDDNDAGNVTTISSGGVTISFNSEGASTHSRVWQATGGITLRVYKGSTFTVSSSKQIVNITFDAQDSNFGLAANPEGLSGKTWTGAATSVTFTPSKTNQIRSISVYFDGDAPTPTPTIDWTSSADAPLTVAAALEKAGQLTPGDDSGKDVYVKGIISQIVEVETETYGNATYYISDDGNSGTQLEVFRGYGLGGEKFTAEDDIEEGDEVIVVGVIMNYVDKEGNSTLEFKQGNKIYSLNGVTSGGETPTPQPSGEAKGDGSLSNPFNAVAATQAASALASGQNSTERYYIQGKVSSIKYSFSAQYGTATFFISEDGTETNQFQVYSTYYLGNRAWVEGDTQIQLGDDVIIYGLITNYKGDTPETASKESYLYSLNGVTDGGEQPGPGSDIDWTSSAAAPLTVAAVIEKAGLLEGGAKSGVEVYVKGIVSEIEEVYVEKGNATYYISDNGQTDNQFYIYRGKSLGGEDFTAEDELKVGDEVVVVGVVTNYVDKEGNSTLEITTGSKLYSLNGVTEKEPEPGPEPTETRDAPITDPYSVAELIGIVTESKESVQDGAWVKGYIVGYINGNSLTDNTAVFSADAPEGTDKNGEPLTVANTNILIADAADASSVAEVAPIALKNNSDARNDLNLADNPDMLGKVVWVKGNVSKYMGVTGLRDVTDYSLDGSTIVAIRDLSAAAASQVIYNLAGQRVANPAKGGIYIVGGRKMVK